MQVFVPFPDIFRSVDLLCRPRLVKQCVECTQIINILDGRTQGKGWTKHPATKLWQGYSGALKLYKNIAMDLAERKYKVNWNLLQKESGADTVMPDWWGQEDIHHSHLANLKRKATLDYVKGRPELKNNMVTILGEARFNEIDETLPYIWS